jgi:hypothetical protein
MLPQYIAVESRTIRGIFAGFVVPTLLLAEVVERALCHRHISIGIRGKRDRPNV